MPKIIETIPKKPKIPKPGSKISKSKRKIPKARNIIPKILKVITPIPQKPIKSKIKPKIPVNSHSPVRKAKISPNPPKVKKREIK